MVPWFNYRYFKNFTKYFEVTKPILNEDAMSPDQIGFLQQQFPVVRYSNTVFSGQRVVQPYKCLDHELLDLPMEVRSEIYSAYGTVRGNISDYLETFKIGFRVDSNNIKARNDLLQTFIARNQLKSALFSWYTRERYPLTPKQYKFLSLKFRDNLYKKIHVQKTSYLKSIESIVGPHKFETMKVKNIGVLTPLEQENLKIERIKAMSKYNLVDQVSQAKAEVIAVRDEIDKNIMVHAIDIIEKEYAALSSALDRDASGVSAYIHPFQQFTSV